MSKFSLYNKTRRLSITIVVVMLSWLFVARGCVYLPHSAQVDLQPQQVGLVVLAAQPAEKRIMQAFDEHNFVALGDYHWNEAFIRYAITLISTPEFSEKVQHIVVEFGNAKYQSVLNDYLAGKDVEEEKLHEVLRGSIYFLAWMPAVYMDFFKAVRVRNAELADNKKIIVHLAEAPFDWPLSNTKKWKYAAENKTDYFYKIAAQRFNNNEKALLIFGAFHLVTAPQKYINVAQANVLPLATRLELRYPGSTYLIWPMTEPEVVKTFADIIPPALVDVRSEPMKGLRFIDLLPKARFKLNEMGDMHAQVGDFFDAFLYVGDNQRSSIFPRAVMSDRVWVAEMQRRVDMIGGKLQGKFNDIRKRSDEKYGF